MTKLILFVVSCLFIAVFISMNTAEESIYASLFSGLAGYRVRNPLTSFTLSDSYLFECCMRCLQYKKCYSVNINGDDRFCEINTLGPSGYGDLVDANGIWTLFIRTNGKKNVAGDPYSLADCIISGFLSNINRYSRFCYLCVFKASNNFKLEISLSAFEVNKNIVKVNK